MARRFLPVSKLLGLMIGCGLGMTSLATKAEQKPHKDFKSLSDTTENAIHPMQVQSALVKSVPVQFALMHIQDLSASVTAIDKELTTKTLDYEYPETSNVKTAPLRTRLSLEMPFACRHSATTWNTEYGELPVQFNENNNLGLLLNYAVKQGRKYDLTIGGGFYTNSHRGTSKMLKAEYTRYIGKTNRFMFGAEIGAVTYEEHIHKDFRDINGQKTIIPIAQGKDMILPAYRIKAGVNIINNNAMRMGLNAGHTYNPKDKLHIMTFGMTFGLNKKIKKQPRTGFGGMYFSHNKQDMNPQTHAMSQRTSSAQAQRPAYQP